MRVVRSSAAAGAGARAWLPLLLMCGRFLFSFCACAGARATVLSGVHSYVLCARRGEGLKPKAVVVGVFGSLDELCCLRDVQQAERAAAVCVLGALGWAASKARFAHVRPRERYLYMYIRSKAEKIILVCLSTLSNYLRRQNNRAAVVAVIACELLHALRDSAHSLLQ